MIETPHYPNAPIAEAIFDIQSALNGSLDQGGFIEIAKAIVGEEYSTCLNLRSSNIELTPGAENMGVKAQSDWMGCEFKHKDGAQVIRIRKDGMSFHRLRPYPTYDDLLPEVQSLWSNYVAAYTPKAVIKTSLRYVNRINIPPDTKIGQLSEYVKVVPHVALPSEADIQNLLSRVHIKEPSSRNNAHITFSSIQKKDELLGILLDVEAWSDSGSSAESNELWDHFASLRELKNRLFTGSLKEKCLNLFK